MHEQSLMDRVYIKVCKIFSRIKYEKESKPSKELVDALEFLGWKEITPVDVVDAAKGITLVSLIFFIFMTVIAAFLGLNVMLFIFLAAGAPLILNHFISEYPKNNAKEQAIASLSAAPFIITQMATALKQNPNLERAVEFVGKYGEGRLAKEFRELLKDIWTGEKESLFKSMPEFADKWGKWSEGFQRSLYLILSSFSERGMKKKSATLSKAVEVMLYDFIDKMREYANSLHIPTMMLFSFGIIMPLILVSVFPLVSFFGGNISLDAIILFLLFSLIGVYFYSGMILRKRPPTFSVADVEDTLPKGYIKIGEKYFPAIPLCLFIAAAVSVPGILYLIVTHPSVVADESLVKMLQVANTLPIIFGAGIAIASYYYLSYAYKKPERDKIKRIDEAIPDVLYYIRNTLSEGKPIEEAFEFVAKMKKGTELGEQFENAAKLIRRRHISFEDVVSGHESPFYKGSKLLNASLSIILTSMKKGIVATIHTCTTMIEHISKLKKIERNMINMLQRNLSMMRMTAMIFAPAVTAIVVVLFQLIVTGILATTTQNIGGAFSELTGLPFFGTGPVQKPSFSPEILQLVLGLYMIGLNFVLIRYITIICYGYDKIQMGLEISKSTAVAMAMFVFVLIVMKSFMNV